MKKDSRKTLFASVASFFSGTLLSRISGLARDISMAYCFGTSASVAAFLVAFRLSHLLRRVFGEGALQNAFIPSFESKRHDDKQAAAKFFVDLKASLLLLLIAITALLMLFCLCVNFAFNISPDTQEIVTLTAFLMPSLIFICLFGLNAAFLQAHQNYFLSSIAPVAFNLLWIIGAFFSYGLPPEKAMERLSIFVILACFFQWAVTLPKTHQFLKKDLSLKNIYLAHPFSKAVQGLLKPFSLGILGVAAAQINSALDPLFARYVDPEGPAYLWYALRIQQLPIGLFAVAASSALLPPLSRAAKKGETETFSKFLKTALFYTSLVMAVATIGLMLFGHPIIDLLYTRGDFNAVSSANTNLCLAAYSFGLVPQGMVLILAPALYAKGNYSAAATASSLSVVMNILLNALFVFGLGFGSFSVALATSISSFFNAAYLVIAYLNQQKNLVIGPIGHSSKLFPDSDSLRP